VAFGARNMNSGMRGGAEWQGRVRGAEDWHRDQHDRERGSLEARDNEVSPALELYSPETCYIRMETACTLVIEYAACIAQRASVAGS
jgi:hypothetical protein